MMSIEQRTIPGDITVVQIAGRITAGHHTQELARTIDGLMQADARRVIFDLAEANYLDSTGLGIIVMYGGKLRRSSGELRIASATGVVANTLTLCKVSEIIPCYPTLDDATKSFGLAAGAA